MSREFIYTSEFEKRIKKFGFSEIDERDLENEILDNPKQGNVIPGTSSLRKFRFSKKESNKGKSGSFRIFYLDLEEKDYIIFMAILSKNEQENLSDEEKNYFNDRVNQMKKIY